MINIISNNITDIYFVRHAEPNYNNHKDEERELTEKGLKDRSLVTDFLKDKNIELVLSSPFKRAIDTVKEFADENNLDIEKIYDFRERKVDSCWIENFTEFAINQWTDFNYKLSDGECLKEVQERNIKALNKVLKDHKGKNIVVGSHGTAISVIINYYDSSFNYDEFNKIRHLMPFIAKFTFSNEKLKNIEIFDLLNN